MPVRVQSVKTSGFVGPKNKVNSGKEYMRKLIRSVAKATKRNVGKIAAAVTATAATVQSQAALDTNVTGLASDVSQFFDNDIKPVVIGVVGFVLVLSYVKHLKRR